MNTDLTFPPDDQERMTLFEKLEDGTITADELIRLSLITGVVLPNQSNEI